MVPALLFLSSLIFYNILHLPTSLLSEVQEAFALNASRSFGCGFMQLLEITRNSVIRVGDIP